MKFHREVKVGLLIKKTIAYRTVVTLTQIVVAYILTGSIEFSVGFSLLWNVINTIEYFGFDYVFSRFYKVGKNDVNGRGRKK